MDRAAFFRELWLHYAALTPQAPVIRALFGGETVINDHVAFRTFAATPLALDKLEPRLLALGYRRHAPYAFPDKHLAAWGYVCDEDPDAPLVFLSELDVTALSPASQAILAPLLAAIPPQAATHAQVFCEGPMWPGLASQDYEALAQESEYAAWLAVHGMTANHFTIAVHRLDPLLTLSEVCEQVQAAGFALNTSGGMIKGTPVELLEQASTLADRQKHSFADGVCLSVPTCYYEFARRYPAADGRLYQGFVAASASRIFESTDRRPT
ncbi:DUF1338 domain-containing protein [Chitinilyticum piscinae]|uniref:2-oxoadipate dioxygenase/decarboxylase n=1 Tax=Chitinilyticum piscinae TaxID=2866724 RepID=A0A8J7FK31_9NEIS|nr:DUF1338 domain-containing protein [Chitinilyticum piscinae]MBE9609377.1 DUF1338 domain-containing protein [Chitinilyticum piscinae]